MQSDNKEEAKSPMQELNTKQYYETVDVAELPPTDKDILGTSDVVTMIFEDGAMEQGYFEFNSKKWIYPEFIKTQPVSWLRPVSLSELIREVATPAPVAELPKEAEGKDTEAWEAWEEDQKTNPNPVNPHAFVYGYNIAKKKYARYWV